jgi:hypothetical protein
VGSEPRIVAPSSTYFLITLAHKYFLPEIRFSISRENKFTFSSSAAIQTWSQFYDFELQRQRCKKLHRNYVIAWRIFIIKIFFSDVKTL